jgi:hypothetical protein
MSISDGAGITSESGISSSPSVSFNLGITKTSQQSPQEIFGASLRVWLDATNPAGRTLDTSGSETYSSLINLASGFGSENLSNATKATQPTSANDSGTGLKCISASGSQFLLGNLTAISGDFFMWVVWRAAPTYTANRQLISLANSTSAGQQWFNAPPGCLPYTSTFAGADFHGAWQPSNYRSHTNTVPANGMASTSAFFPQANGANMTLYLNNADALSFVNSAARGNIDRAGFGAALGSATSTARFFEFGLVTGSPSASQRAALHSILRAKYAGLA